MTEPQKILFPDDGWVERMDSLTRTLHQPDNCADDPVLAGGCPWESRHAQGRTGPQWIPPQGATGPRAVAGNVVLPIPPGPQIPIRCPWGGIAPNETRHVRGLLVRVGADEVAVMSWLLSLGFPRFTRLAAVRDGNDPRPERIVIPFRWNGPIEATAPWKKHFAKLAADQ